MQDFRYLYYLTKAENLGSVRIRRLLDHFGDARSVFESSPEQITMIDGFSSRISDAIFRSTESFGVLEDEYEKLCTSADKLNVRIITLDDDLYPIMLKEIYDPPVILYVRASGGDDVISKLNNNSVGIVGTRKPSDYGKKMAELLSKGLSSAGVNVVSGFARGIDTYAHKAALECASADSITVGVFGCGVDRVYPPENKKLYDEICEKGALISEYELGAFPDGVNFPRRNRIISGLSKGVAVIESAKEGGALITAYAALDQGREVFAVPGYVTSKNSEGTNYLIKSGQAKLVENVDDILVELRVSESSSESQKELLKQTEMIFESLSGNERTVYELISGESEPIHIDMISEKAGLNISDCLVTLLNLEFKGLVSQLPGKRFTITA